MDDKLIVYKPMYFADKADCGYCHGSKADSGNYYALKSWYQYLSANRKDDATSDKATIRSCTVGFQCESMPVENYDRMCNMGFRRSGLFVYKTDPLRNCCRLYTIRTTPGEVELTKELRKCINRYRTHLGLNKMEPPKDIEESQYKFVNDIVSVEAQVENSTFHTKFGPAIYTDEKYELFVKYQELIHNDYDHSKKGFKRFLCDAPFSKAVIMGTEEEWEQLNNWKTMKTGEKLLRVGPVHESYYHNGKLIALAITDFLPSGISSVYFIWHPDYHKWSLGKLSALRELALLEKSNLDYYYLGYYIEDCKKMKYKANYGGELLDTSTERYYSIKQVNLMIQEGKLFITGDTTKEYTREPPLNDAFDKCSFRDTIEIQKGTTANEKMGNVVERVYGTNSRVFEPSYLQETVRVLNDYGVDYDINQRPKDKFRLENTMSNQEIASDDITPNFNIPLILPGIVPLWELRELLETNRLQRQLVAKTLIFDMHTASMRLFGPWEYEDNDTKTAVCNVVRLLGLEMASHSIIAV